MEYASIEREIYVDATPDVVFEVISKPEHLREWWPDDAALDSSGVGELVFGTDAEAAHVPLKVIDSAPPRVFSFRWCYDPAVEPSTSNSFLVSFELTPSGTGTSLRMTETGFREQGFTEAVVEESYLDHVNGWDMYIPRLGTYAGGLVTS
jgi:uncharacterized protein YndB with AHSA1/START domain